MQRRLLSVFIVLFILLNAVGQDSLSVKKSGIYTGISFGTWFPDNNNKVLGNPLLMGFVVDFKGEKNALGFTFDLIGWPNHKTKEPLSIKFGDSILTRDNFFGGLLTVDYAREFWNKNRFLFEGIGGIGYSRLS